MLPVTAHTAHAPSVGEKHLEDILSVAAMAATAALNLLNILSIVVPELLLGIVQNSEGFPDVLEHLLSLLPHLLISIVSIRVPLEGHFLIRFLNFLFVRILPNFQDLVIIFPFALFQLQFSLLQLLPGVKLP